MCRLSVEKLRKIHGFEPKFPIHWLEDDWDEYSCKDSFSDCGEAPALAIFVGFQSKKTLEKTGKGAWKWREMSKGTAFLLEILENLRNVDMKISEDK